MSWEKTIRERRSIRKFNSDPVTEEQIAALFREAEGLCPYDGQARWRYLYAGTEEARRRLADYLLEKVLDSKMARLVPGKLIEVYRKRFMEAQANVVVIAEKDDDPLKHDENYGTVCRILQNAQLLGWKRKLGMIWVTESYIQNETFFARIGLQASERFVGVLQIGYFDKTPKGKSRTPAERFWTDDGERPDRSGEIRPDTRELVLELLNHAVWAPNHGLREPWRFHYRSGNAVRGLQTGTAEARELLIVTNKQESDELKRNENLAATFCLVQNFKLLGEERGLAAQVVYPEWMRDREACRRLGIPDKERTAVVVEIVRGPEKIVTARVPSEASPRWSLL